MNTWKDYWFGQLMSKFRSAALIPGFILFLTSCEYSYDYSYKITNETESQIKVYVKTFRIDSTFQISKDSTSILFVKDHGIEGSKGPYFDDVTVDLDSLTVTKDDAIRSTRNYLENDAWTFKEGVYSTTVTDDEFR
jgi:hypothetical protein